MPYYRRTYRRRTFRPRRITRKRVYRRKFSRFGRRKMNTNVYYFKRKSSTIYDWSYAGTGSPLTEINVDTVGQPIVRNFAFRLMDVPGYTDFTNMYDSYRLRAVKVNLIPVANVSTWNGATGMPSSGQYSIRAFSAFDPNTDSIGITGSNAVQQIQEYQNCKWTPYNRIHKRYIKPKIEMTTPGGIANVNLAGKQPWLQCADTGATVHYGMPFVIDASNIPQGVTMYKVEATYYMQFARPK